MEDFDSIVNTFALERLYGGNNNQVYSYTSNKEKYCIKLYRDADRAIKEVNALSFMHASKMGLCPIPLQFSNQCFPILVMSYIEGDSFGEIDITDIHLRKLSSALKSLYELETDGTTWAVNCNSRRMYNRVVEQIQNVTPGGSPSLKLAHRLISIWLESVNQNLFNENKCHFSHGDPNLHNLVWAEGDCKMIDFEYAGWSEKLFDLADLLEHPQSRKVNDYLWDEFMEGFSLTKEERITFKSYRTLVSIFWLMKFWPSDNDTEINRVPDLFMSQLNRVEAIKRGLFS